MVGAHHHSHRSRKGRDHLNTPFGGQAELQRELTFTATDHLSDLQRGTHIQRKHHARVTLTKANKQLWQQVKCRPVSTCHADNGSPHGIQPLNLCDGMLHVHHAFEYMIFEDLPGVIEHHPTGMTLKKLRPDTLFKPLDLPAYRRYRHK